MTKTGVDTPSVSMQANVQHHTCSLVQFVSDRRYLRTRIMFRLAILACVFVELIRARNTGVTEKPETLVEKLDKLVEKIDRFTIPPPASVTDRTLRLYAKLEQLDALNPDGYYGLSDEEEEVLSKLQQGAGLSPEELESIAKELQEIRRENQGQSEKILDSDIDDGWDVSYFILTLLLI